MVSEKVNDFQVSKNFNLREFQSPDTCEVILHPRLVECLQKLRDKIHQQIKITSGYRTPERNKAVGGVHDSYHMVGKAVDIVVEGITAKEMEKHAKECGFTYMKYYPDRKFFHLDIRDEERKEEQLCLRVKGKG